MSKKSIQVKVFVDDDDYAHLEELAQRLDRSMSAIIRESFNWRYKMQIEAQPTCANGRACFVAAMHFAHTPHATQVSQVTEAEAARLIAPPLAAAI